MASAASLQEMRFVPLFDVYDEEGNWLRTMAGDAITISDPKNIEVAYGPARDAATYFWGTLTTVYGNAIDTEVLVIEQTHEEGHTGKHALCGPCIVSSGSR